MKKLLLFAVVTVLCAAPRASQATSSYYRTFTNRYSLVSTRLNTCAVCHDENPGGAIPAGNPYGVAVLGEVTAGNAISIALANLEPADSDGDGFSNLTEIQARTFPGDPADKPVASAPVIGVSPATLAFGNVLRGSAATLQVTITNTGNAALSVSSLTPSGTAEFSLTNAAALPAPVPAGGSLKVTVRYAPANVGPDTGSLAIGSNDSAHPSVNVALTGTGIAPALTVTPGSLAFGSLIQGQTTNLTVTLGNTGSATCNVTGLNKTGSTDFSFGSGAPVPPFAITPGSTIAVPLSYTPSNVGADSGSLQVVSDDPVNPSVNVALSGNGNPVPATINLTIGPATLAFGSVRVGQSASLNATIGNAGGATGTVSVLGVTGTDFAPGGGAPATPFKVAPGASITVPVAYSPTSVGNGIGSLSATTDDPNHPTLTVSLTGNGVQSHIGVTPVAADFGTITLGGNASRSVIITNAGGASLTVTAVTLTASAEFTPAVGNPTVPFTVNAGKSATITLQYAPIDIGTDAGTLDIGSDAPNAPAVAVSLGGAGQLAPQVPQVGVTPLALNFGDVRVGQSGTLTVTVNNTGGADAAVAAPSLAGSADFSAGGGSFTVAASGSQTVTVQYAPAGVGADAGTLTVTSNDPNHPTVNVTLAGRGVQSALSVTPATVAFGSVVTNGTVARVVTIVNNGSASAQVSGLALSGTAEFTLGAGAPAVPFTVAAGANVDVPLSYRPTNVGSDTGSLDVTSDDPTHPTLTVSLTGSGVGSGVAVDFDISSFQVPSSYVIGTSRAFQPSLRVLNRSRTTATRSATVVGVQNDTEVYRVTKPVTLRSRSMGAVTFPAFAPAAAGVIQWTATVEDDDPDADVTTATTKVTVKLPEPEHEDGTEVESESTSGSSSGWTRWSWR